MKITIRNQAKIPKKYLRFAKWKIRRVKRKFNALRFFEAYISKEGKGLSHYRAVVRLGVPGHAIILIHKSDNLHQLWRDTMVDVQRYLQKHKRRQLERKVQALFST